MLGLGTSLVHGGTPMSAAGMIVSVFASRVADDGGEVENTTCLLAAVKELM